MKLFKVRVLLGLDGNDLEGFYGFWIIFWYSESDKRDKVSGNPVEITPREKSFIRDALGKSVLPIAT